MVTDWKRGGGRNYGERERGRRREREEGGKGGKEEGGRGEREGEKREGKGEGGREKGRAERLKESVLTNVGYLYIIV